MAKDLLLKTKDRDRAEQLIWHYRKTGASWQDIAAEVEREFEVSLTEAQVARVYRGYMTSMASTYGPEARDQALGMELERLNAIQNAFWDLAMSRDDKAATTVLNVMKQRHKLLGLDMPEGSDQGVQNNILIVGNDKEEWLKALAQGKQGGRIMPGAAGDDVEEHEEG